MPKIFNIGDLVTPGANSGLNEDSNKPRLGRVIAPYPVIDGRTCCVVRWDRPVSYPYEGDHYAQAHFEHTLVKAEGDPSFNIQVIEYVHKELRG